MTLVLLFIVAMIIGFAAIVDDGQFHRPVVACTMTGAVLGDLTTGIILGGTLEMMALGWMNIGAAVALLSKATILTILN